MIILETLLSGWVFSQKGYDINCRHYSQSIKLSNLRQLTCIEWPIDLLGNFAES